MCKQPPVLHLPTKYANTTLNLLKGNNMIYPATILEHFSTEMLVKEINSRFQSMQGIVEVSLDSMKELADNAEAECLNRLELCCVEA